MTHPTFRSGLLLCVSLASLPLQAQVPADPFNYGRSSRFEYVNGLLSAEVIEPDNVASCVRTVYGRDAYGNKTSATTSNCDGTVPVRQQFASRTATTSYTSAQTVTVEGVSVSVPLGLFPIVANNALNQSETRQYDPRFGAVTRLTGPNGLSTQWTVDEFGRVTRELRADGTSTVSYYCYLTSSGLDTSSNTPNCPVPDAAEVPTDAAYFVHTESRDTANLKMGPFNRVYSDRVARTIRTVTERFDGASQPASVGDVIVKDTLYSSYGAKYLETQPYFLATKSSTTSGSNDYGMTLTHYDALGRVFQVYVADPNGSMASISFGGRGNRPAARTQMLYQGLRTTITNDKGLTRTEEKSVDGKVIRVTDAFGAQTVRQYDAFDNLVLTRDALQNVIATGYDIRGRKVQMNDPDSGLWMYDYNALGELVWQQNANQRAVSQQTTMAYDVLGRSIQRVEPEYTSTWSYDKYADGSACNKGIGKLCEVVTSHGVNRRHVYDNLGRPASSRTTITSGPSFASAISYSTTTGRPATQTYPTGLQVAYGYTTKGFVEKLTLATAATVNPLPATTGGTPGSSAALTAGSLLWQAQVVNAFGQSEKSLRGNNVASSASIEAATGRTKVLTAGIGAATNVLNYSYTWDSLNNLKTRADANGDGTSGAVTETYVYDEINRLVDYTVASAAISGLSRKVTLHYNAIGSLLYKSDLGAYDTTGSRPHATVQLASVTTTDYAFDANGNVVTASGGKYRGLTYTSFNLPDSQTGVRGPANTPQYLWQYDAEHQRIKETRVTTGAGAATRVTWMLHPDNTGGLSFESETTTPVSGPVTTANRHYLAVGGETVGVLVQMAALPTLGAGVTTPPAIGSITLVKVEYWHRDHLGSLAATTDHTGAVTARYAYDPFGQRRQANGVYDYNGVLLADYTTDTNRGTDRGFTGHEHLDDIGLIHMNGRLYDPQLARFLQADPFIQDIDNLQAFNRYSYCYGNPLNCTDPSGYFSWKKFWKKARPFVAIVAAAVVSVATYGAASEFFMSSVLQSAAGSAGFSGASMFATATAAETVTASLTVTGAAVSGAAAGAAGAFAGTMIATGDLRAASHAALIGAVGGAVFGAVGGYFGSSYPIERVGANTLASGINSRLQGGHFVDGLRSGLIVASLTYLNVEMRNLMIENSSGNPGNDGRFRSYGLLGDNYKLGGGRFNPFEDSDPCSPFGCQQNGAGKIFGNPYGKGSFIDVLVETYAGPHDLANSPWFYAPDGTIRAMSAMEKAWLDLTTNYTTSLLFATPFALSALSETAVSSSYLKTVRDAARRSRYQ